MKTDKELLNESLRFIDNNIDALSNEVPLELIRFWIVENIDLEAKHNDYQDSIFMYALIKQVVEKGLPELYITPIRLVNLYQNWQNLLNTIMINYTTDMHIEPFRLFDFQNYETLELSLEK